MATAGAHYRQGQGGPQMAAGPDQSYQHSVPAGHAVPMEEVADEHSPRKKTTVVICGRACDRDLVVAKGFYFFFFAAFGSLFPLIAIYFKQLAMSATQAGLLIGIRPFVEYASSPFWSSFADKFRQGKKLLLFTILCWIVSVVAINFIQPRPPYCLVAVGGHQRALVPADLSKEDMVSFISQGVKAVSGGGGASAQKASAEKSEPAKKRDKREEPEGQKDEAAAAGEGEAKGAPDDNADNPEPVDAGEAEQIDKEENADVVPGEPAEKGAESAEAPAEGENQAAEPSEKEEPAPEEKAEPAESGEGETEEKTIQEHMEAADFLQEKAEPGIAPYYIDNDAAVNYDEAKMGAVLRPPHSDRCFRLQDVQRVFVLLLLIIAVGELFSSPAVALADGCVLNYVKDQPVLFARQRLLGSLGWAVSMFLIGLLLTWSTFSDHPCAGAGARRNEKNYALNFTAYAVLMLVTLCIATQFKFPADETQRPDEVPAMIMDAQNEQVAPAVANQARAAGPEPSKESAGRGWLGVLRTFSAPQHVMFLFVTWWMGMGVGIVFTFLFWHLQDIGGNPAVYGIASVINHVSELAAYFFGFELINKYGHVRVVYFGLAANAARFLYVSLIGNAWLVLPIELLQGVTHSVTWAAASSYMSLIAPFEQKQNAQHMLCALHNCLGKGLGSIVAGVIITYTGTTLFFQIYAGLSAALLVVYALLNRVLKLDTVHSAKNVTEQDAAQHLAPHGIPAHVPYDTSGENMPPAKVAIKQPSKPDPTQDAYDQYVTGGYQR